MPFNIIRDDITRLDTDAIVNDRKEFQISEKLFAEVQSYIDERLIKPDDLRRIAEDGVTREAYNLYAPQKAMGEECLEELCFWAIVVFAEKAKPFLIATDMCFRNLICVSLFKVA